MFNTHLCTISLHFNTLITALYFPALMTIRLLNLLSVLVIVTTVSSVKFKDWIKLHQVKYGPQEKEIRQAIWEDNVRFIEEYNKKQTGVFLQINEFGDLTNSEFRALRTTRQIHDVQDIKQFQPPVGEIIPESKDWREENVVTPVGEIIPESKDWREENVVTPVKNQGDCGSCYAFSAVSAISSMLAIRSGELVALSEQQVIDCSAPWGNNGCDGGAPQVVFQYAHETAGLLPDVDYPYTGTGGVCKANYTLAVAHVDGWERVKKYSEQDLKWAVGLMGPVSVGVDAGERSFQFYKSGVYSDPMCMTSRIDHAVVVVGYGTTDKGIDYWIVRNSWGDKWGMQGYFWLARNKQNMCGVASQALFPLVSLR